MKSKKNYNSEVKHENQTYCLGFAELFALNGEANSIMKTAGMCGPLYVPLKAGRPLLGSVIFVNRNPNGE